MRRPLGGKDRAVCCGQMQATVRSLTLTQYVSAAAGVEARVDSDATTMAMAAKR